MKTFLDLLKMMYQKRWVRYLSAAVFLLLGALLGLQGYVGMQTQTASGAIASVTVVHDAQSGEYQEHRIVLTGRPDHFIVEKQYFSPALSDAVLQQGAQVELWYTQAPLLDPDVIALQVTDVSGATTTYVTRAYTDPQGAQMTGLVAGGLFALFGVLALIAAIWLPAPGRESSGRKQPAPNYGNSVVGPPRR